MRVLITGAAGLIGWWTSSTLSDRGDQVIGLDVAGPPEGLAVKEYIKCDILDSTHLRRCFLKAAPDTVIHLAARTDLLETRNISGYAANIEGVKNVVDAIRHVPTIRRCIFTSSRLVCRTGYVPTSMDEYCPHTVYGESKVLTEKIVKENQGGGVEWCLVRPTTVWGPHMNLHYQQMLRLIRRGRYFHCGKAKLFKSYSYVGNIAWQYAQLLSAPREGIHERTFYLADYEPLSLRDYADDLAKHLSAPKIPTMPLLLARALALFGDSANGLGWRGFPFNSFRLQNILTEDVFDMRATENVCGPLPHGVEEGVKATAQWYLSLENDKRN